MDTPRFTVVTPSFNQGAFIEKTIDSVLSQGYPNLEYIIIDGGSTDTSVEVIKKYERHLAYWVSEKDRGQSHAINKGMARATGEYLTWLNSDDWYLPEALNSMLEMFSADPAVGVVVGAGKIVDTSGREMYHKEPTVQITLESLYTWLNEGNFMQPSSSFRARDWHRVGGVDENVHIAFDLDLWLRMAKAGSQFSTTREVLSIALSHPDAKTTAFKEYTRLDCAMMIHRHGGESIARKILENMAQQLFWYRKNYENIVNQPILKAIRPLIKRFSRSNATWQARVPPWVNQ